MSDLVVAAVQMTSTENVDANLQRARELVREAAGAGALLIGLPENFAYLGNDNDHRLNLAEALPVGGAKQPESAPGPILTAMQELARGSGAWLLLGGFPERAAGRTSTAEPSKGSAPPATDSAGQSPAPSTRLIRNTAVLLDPNGTIVATYRKIHLFDVDVPGGRRFRESESIEAGADVVVAETPWGGVGLSICYDLRFPELYRQLTARGARLIAVPSAFTLQTGKDHWHTLLRARAIENQVFVMAPAQFGAHGPNRASYGHALVADPWGAVIAECGDHDGFALARLDFAYQDQVRAALPCLTHKRL